MDKALEYHMLDGVPGKVSVVPTKPCRSAEDLSYAYTPGVAKPVLEIEKDPDDAYRYTSKGNLVAVISNGTAILGLGDRGALASKPVMEGKGVLFKRFADIDVFDIEIDEKDPDRLIEIIRAMSPTFGGINLEDIKGPECFRIEQELIEKCDIPVFHDDQHGTAIIATAGLINACDIVGKSLDKVRVVVNGAGAAGISCSKMFLAAGVRRENLVLCDSIVFAMANPDPEITYEKAMATRDDVIMATGRSDYPNQINNVLGFPFIFRGALDVRATRITENMKMAAAKALASLARKDVPDEVSKAYGGQRFSFGRDYIVPKPFDPRVIEEEAVAVAMAACQDGVARRPIEDWDAYRDSLARRMAKYWS